MFAGAAGGSQPHPPRLVLRLVCLIVIVSQQQAHSFDGVLGLRAHAYAEGTVVQAQMVVDSG
jgi:hypothetical protein